MDFDRSHHADEHYAGQTERLRQALRDSGIPIVALSDATKPAVEWFGGCTESDDAIISVRIVYKGAGAGGPWASVETARSAGSVPLRSTLERQLRLRGDRSPAAEWTEGDATVIVDGRPVAGRIVRAGNRWWAARCERGDVEISVMARDWHPGTIAVDTLVDLVPMLRRLASRPSVAPEPVPVPEGVHPEPHRALVDAVLRSSQEHAEWRADGGPMPELPRHWSALWRAAVHRHVSLTDEPEARAEYAVAGMVNQLSSLQRDAAWFREDARLRERAIAETLLYGTGLSDRVPSLQAQRAWHRQQERAPSVNRAEAGAAAHRQWLDAWTAWADDQPGP